MNKTLLLQIAALLAILSTPAMAKHNDKAWLDAKVVAIGHVSSNGTETPTATIVLFDPGNANPLARQQAWAITLQAAYSRTKVNLSVGTSFKAYRTGETGAIYGFLAIRFVDDKGREKEELHPIVTALDLRDIP
jgi:hypothetical protein